MEKRLIQWLATGEIDNMQEYVEELKSENIPGHARIAVWGLAFTKSWHRRTERPQFALFNTLISCTKKLPCPDCHRRDERKRAEEAQRETSQSTKGIVRSLESAISGEKEEEKEKEKDEKEKDEKDEEEKEEEKEKEDDDDESEEFEESEIESILSHLDCDFAREANKHIRTKERHYMMQVVMKALKNSYEYNMLISCERVNKKNMDKIFGICIGAFTYFSSYRVEKIFKVAFFLASNINGIFCSKRGLDMTKKEFDRFLLFVQNTAALSKNKFMILMDVISCLNQEILAEFVYGIVKGSISVSGMQKDLLDKYGKESAGEIEAYKKAHPFCLLSKFTPRIVFIHQQAEKSLNELKKENSYLKENIETLLCDLKYANSSELIGQLKRDIAEKDEQIRRMEARK
ncbi:uncharacterized protein NEMAJ01_0752 [Nematocida major]|uniref:uncharacterized protein n=1 Tax=Nematocida major TaxID=1912982 RepID=UPI0020076EDF|nr:uncharacterized protein NEMAJ01_0752 [Nematocida major]KAH9385856.1 hypothetical protein NEMAJ01_0752 [Nematocida major]